MEGVGERTEEAKKRGEKGEKKQTGNVKPGFFTSTETVKFFIDKISF